MLLSKTLRLFLDAIGRRDEYEFYLRKFMDDPRDCFAALVPDAESLEQAGELMAFDLAFLLRLELTPLVLLCGPEALRMRAWMEASHEAPSRIVDIPPGSSLVEAVEQHLPAARHGQQLLTLCVPDQTLDALAGELLPGIVRRVHIIRLAGELQDTGGRSLDPYLLQTPPPGGLNRDESELLATASACLDHYPAAHVSVASPLNLLRELFTVRGAGTVIRRGSLIEHLTDRGAVDLPRLEELLSHAFGKSFQNPALFDEVSDFYLEEQYRGAVLLEPHPAARYLSKYAVGKGARGEGLAQELWDRVIADCPSLFWRSRSANPVNTWYDRHADGRHCAGSWTVFWRGIETGDLPGIIDYAISRPPDFQESPA